MEGKRNAAVLDIYPPYDRQEIDLLLTAEAELSGRKIIVLDDDPTGVQTVHDVSVYTDWSLESIRDGFAEKNKLFFILTNSRGFTVEQTTKAHQEIGARVDQVAKEMGMEYLIVSRGDSTLRGHYPLETRLLKEAQEAGNPWKIDGEILCPFFAEGGRFTIDNVHYVRYGEELVPAGETEFARDKTFGYQSSNLCDYIEEKTEGAYKADSVICISLEDLRAGKLEQITGQLMSVSDFGKIIVNAVDEYDVKMFCIALYRALERGKHFTFRTAAALGNISDKPLLTREEMVTLKTPAGGIVVIGSHTKKTTMQMEELKKLKDILFIEMNSDLVLQEGGLEGEVERILSLSGNAIRNGQTVAIYTRRQLLTVENDTKDAALVRSVKISDAVQSLVGRLEVTPGFVVAKGGITSSDVGTKALQVKRATVLGQIRPGIPVWQTLREAVEILMGQTI